MADSRRRLDRFVWIVLGVALALRVVVMLTVFTHDTAIASDTHYYITVARAPWRLGIPEGPYFNDPDFTPGSYSRRVLAVVGVGPIYPAFLVPFFNLIPDEALVAQFTAARLAQALLDTLTVLWIYLVAQRLFGERVGRVALVAQALDLRYVFTAGTIATETLFISLLTGFMLIYVRALSQSKAGPYRLAGLLLALATLTRPVPLLFPAMLVFPAWLSTSDRRQAWRGLAWLLGVMVLVIAPWTIRTSIITGEFTPVSTSAFSQFYRSTYENGGEISTDQALNQAVAQDMGPGDAHTEGSEYVGAGIRRILQAPGAWLLRIARDTATAYGQPFGTVILTPPGTALKETVVAFFRGKASLGQVISTPAFWRRLLMYIWHIWGLVGGMAGIVLCVRRQWRDILPLIIWVMYTTSVTAALLIEPRYVFPTMFVFTILAAYATVRAWDALGLSKWLQSNSQR